MAEVVMTQERHEIEQAKSAEPLWLENRWGGVNPWL